MNEISWPRGSREKGNGSTSGLEAVRKWEGCQRLWSELTSFLFNKMKSIQPVKEASAQRILSFMFFSQPICLCVSAQCRNLALMGTFLFEFPVHIARVLVNAVTMGTCHCSSTPTVWVWCEKAFMHVCAWVAYGCLVQLCGLEEVLWSTYDRVPCHIARIGLIFSSLSAALYHYQLLVFMLPVSNVHLYLLG